MAIHASEKPPMNVKETLSHLAIVTVGILIALSLEGALEWSRHRSLVRQARANLMNEMRDNQKEVNLALARLEKLKTELANARDVVRSFARREKLTDIQLGVSYSPAELRSASRTTAEITGALGYMDYDEVQRFASVYAAQGQFERFQTQTLDHVISLLAAIQVFWDGPDAASAGDLDDLTRGIRTTTASIIAVEQLGASLDREYAKALQSP